MEFAVSHRWPWRKWKRTNHGVKRIFDAIVSEKCINKPDYPSLTYRYTYRRSKDQWEDYDNTRTTKPVLGLWHFVQHDPVRYLIPRTLFFKLRKTRYLLLKRENNYGLLIFEISENSRIKWNNLTLSNMWFKFHMN